MLTSRHFLKIGVVLTIGLLAAASHARADEQKPGAGGKPAGKRALKMGQRPNESDEKYEKRRALLLKRTKKDEDGLYTVESVPFIVRSDIDAEFTVDTALFMEMLHRAYGATYAKMGLPPGPPKEWIEVVVYADQATYIKNGGGEGSGGQFVQTWPFFEDRPPSWKAQHYRLSMFTDGETKFADWPKATLQHEAAHMELQMRLGYFVDSPRWWNEGQASCFEFWDFEKSVDENLKLIPHRGRYAPVVRRLAGTDKFKPFKYVWEIDARSWHKDMTSEQGSLNYCQAWSLAAFMLNEGREGRQAFRTIYDLSKRVGADRKVSTSGKKTLAWQTKFNKADQEKLEKQWLAWIETNLPKDKVNPDEREGLIDLGYDPDAKGLVKLTKERYAQLTKKDKKKKKKTDEDEPTEDASAKKDAGAADAESESTGGSEDY
jgi:hypothetical protein